MSNKKGKGGKKHASRNSTASVKQSRPAANKTATRNTAKPKTSRKGGKGRRNGGGGLFRNPFAGGKIGGIGVTDVVGAGGGVVVGEAGAAVLPQSYIGDVLLLIVAILTAKGLSSFSLTKPFASGAGIGVGAVAFKNGLNRATNGAVTNFFTGITNNVRGYLQPVPLQPQPITNNNDTAGMGRVIYPRRVGQVW